jgi:hypothetical protein
MSLSHAGSMFDFRDLFSHECYFATLYTVHTYPLAVLQYSTPGIQSSNNALPLAAVLCSRLARSVEWVCSCQTSTATLGSSLLSCAAAFCFIPQNVGRRIHKDGITQLRVTPSGRQRPSKGGTQGKECLEGWSSHEG